MYEYSVRSGYFQSLPISSDLDHNPTRTESEAALPSAAPQANRIFESTSEDASAAGGAGAGHGGTRVLWDDSEANVAKAIVR